ncbi:hypothetical protein O0I10_004666 [Lichtheimia ornata]|uniref:Uncharacterized protein n=1 Tax=Lichtheimia ornata TaxID=688661 RepID=A0AAD7V875_9FUNG|nr:uncharacterized protein O0I10_004666 [Lichtheimia ornata]KAJ8659687.1 hypothetical protein O0I10_004666 [Lichtheimia ornata]
MLSLYKRRPKATTLNGLLPEGYTVEENVDTLVFIDYLMFMERLTEETQQYAQRHGIQILKKEHLDEVAKLVLQEFRG